MAAAIPTTGICKPLASLRILATLILTSLSVVTTSAGSTQAVAGPAQEGKPRSTYASLPQAFEVNRGQVDGRVRFLTRGQGYSLFLTVTGMVLTFDSAQQMRRHGPLRLTFAGANRRPKIVGLNRLPGTINYFIGNDPRRWHTDIPTYARIEYRNVYPGIDLVYYNRHNRLEYDWLLAPHANIEAIRLRVSGTPGVRLGPRGNLVLRQTGNLLQTKPVVYQRANSGIHRVTARYIARGPKEVGFALGSYDRTKPLIVDPTLVYSTYLGGGDQDGGMSIAVDRTGAAYVTGDTSSLNFPTEHPVRSSIPDPAACRSRCTDVFVSKLRPDGRALEYSTYLGGVRDDYGHAIAIDRDGNSYVTGNTMSSDFPMERPLQRQFAGGAATGDAFVTKLNASGSALLYSTYLGGKGDDDAEGIAVSSGRAYVTGYTNSADFPRSHALRTRLGGGTCRYDAGTVPCYDAFVTRLNRAGSALDYSTYLGGNGSDMAWGIAVHRSEAYVAGQTSSTNFPIVRPLQRSLRSGSCGYVDQPAPCSDVFLAGLNPAGTRLSYSTYLGGQGDDIANALAVDAAGNAYLTGRTGSRDFPTRQAVEPTLKTSDGSAFVTKVDTRSSALAYSTYLGGAGSNEGYGIAVDHGGRAYVTGMTESSRFPVVRAIQSSLPGRVNVQNAFVAELNATGSGFVYSTYLGGNDHDLGAAITLDRADNAYVTGFATSTNFPTKRPLQRALAGGTFDVFVAKVEDNAGSK